MRKMSVGNVATATTKPGLSTSGPAIASVEHEPSITPLTIVPGSSADENVYVEGAVQAGDIYLDEEYLDALRLFRQNPTDLPKDPNLVLDGVIDLGDQVSFVDHLMAPAGVVRDPALLHPLTDRVRPEMQAAVLSIYAELNIRRSPIAPCRILGASEAIEFERATGITGRVSDLVVYSAGQEKLNEKFVLAALAEALTNQGVPVYCDAEWKTFLVEYRGGSQAGSMGILRCQPFSDNLDHIRFVGLSEVGTNSRRFSTVLSSEVATVDRVGAHSFELRVRDRGVSLQDDQIELTSISRQGDNPWRQVAAPTLGQRLSGLFSSKK